MIYKSSQYGRMILVKITYSNERHDVQVTEALLYYDESTETASGGRTRERL